MSFIAKNPLAAKKVSDTSAPPMGTLGLFPKEDGWYSIDENGNEKKIAYISDVGENNIDASSFATKEEVDKQSITINDHTLALERLKYYGDPNIVPTDISSFTYKDNGDETCCITRCEYVQDLKTVVIPYKIDNMEVTSIGESAFWGCSIKEIVIPSSVTSIGDDAFGFCSIEEIVIPNSVTSIGGGVFYGCSIKEIVIPNSVTSIGGSAFMSCSIKEIVIPNSVTSIGDNAFNGCNSLAKVVIPSSVTSIDYGAFAYCHNLAEAIISSKTLSTIGEDIFYGCESLKKIIISDGVTYINSYLIPNSPNFEKIIIPDSVTEIDLSNITNKNFIIQCNPNSYAETYAKENHIKYQYKDCRSIYSNWVTREVETTITDENGYTIWSILPYIDLYADYDVILSETPISNSGIIETLESIQRNEFAINIPDDVNFGYEAYLSFPVGDTVPTIQYPAGIIFKGNDCDSDGIFTPVANTNYEIAFKYMGIDTDNIPIIVARVGSW